MANLKTDSPVSRRIVNAFLDFIQSVEPAPGVDLEGLEVVKECLQEVFKLDPSSTDDATQPGMLVEYFSSLDAIRQRGSCPSHAMASVDRPSTSMSQDYAEASPSQLPKPKDEHLVGEEPHTLGDPFAGVSKDELFGQLFGGLDKVQFFNDGDEDHTQIDRATSLFHDAVQELERSGCQTIDSRNLAETFKSQGNKAMQLKLYSDAIELYTYAIALCEKNAVYYCNRAAAYTQVEKFVEAITDCQKSISIDPNYSKAYSRLGLAYYAQGNYFDAIDKGFNKALQLDPHSESIKENIQVALQKLNSQGRAGLHQNEGSTSHNNNQEQNGQPAGGSGSRGMPSFTAMPFNPAAFSTDFANIFTNMPSNGNQERSVPPSFTSVSFDSAALPTDFTNMFMNMSGNANQDQHPQEGSHGGTNRGSSDDPEIREGGGNINLNFGENMPEELMGTWRSVMGMFSGVQPHQNSPGDNHRGPTPN